MEPSRLIRTPAPPATLRVLCTTLLLWLGGSLAWAAPALTPDQTAWLAKAHRFERAGWIYLHSEGGPRERGFQHGYLLAREIAENLRLTRRLWTYGSSMEWTWLLDKTSPFLEPKVDSENLAELDGLVEGLKAAGVESSRREMIVFNAWFELDWYWWPKELKKLKDGPAPAVKQSCSSFIATGSATADGGVVLGHNSMVDYPEACFNVVMDLQPAEGHRILMQTAAGWIHSGTDFFVTDAGLVGSETTIGDFNGYEEKGIPEFVRARRAMQDAHSIDDWCAIMRQGNNGGYANAWLIGDVNAREIARLELGLRFDRLEKSRDGYFLGSNIAEDPKVLRLETDANEDDVRLSSIARRVRWQQLMAQHTGKINLGMAKRFEADHFDSFFQRERAGGRTLCGHYELDDQYWGAWPGGPFFPAGTFDGKVVDTAMARRMSFAARWGSACGKAFDAPKFLAAHPQFAWMKDILKSRPSQPWVVFRAGE